MGTRIPVTFIGPVSRDGASMFFEIMSAHGGVIRLDYTSAGLAKAARNDLAKSATAYKVPTRTLYAAIQQLVSDKNAPAQTQRTNHGTADGD